jgi:small-conductance mechanosensitive channel
MMQDPVELLNEEPITSIWERIVSFLDYGIHVGEGDKSVDITIGLLLLVTISFIATKYFLNVIRRIMTRKMDGDDRLKFITIFKYIKYVIYVAVILLTMSAAGIDITLLITASAALFVGIGLALQDLIQDIIAGILIVTDKSLRVEDIVEVDGRVGRVLEIRLRTTLALTRDDKVMIIPNHKFLRDTMYNYTQNQRTTREAVRVGVAYGSDVDLVTQLLLKAVEHQEGVLRNPRPFVLFDDFGDSALLFSVHFHIEDIFTDPRLKSKIRYRIDQLFRENKVTIPFPQRDVHFYAKTPPGKAPDPSPDRTES